eukprot:gene2775-23568_t
MPLQDLQHILEHIKAGDGLPCETIVSILHAAAAMSRAEPRVIRAKATQKFPLHVVGALHDARLIDTLQSADNIARARWLFLGHLTNHEPASLDNVILLAAMKSACCDQVWCLQGESEMPSSTAKLMENMKQQYAGDDLRRMHAAITDFYDSMPLAAYMRGKTIATARALPCVAGANHRLSDMPAVATTDLEPVREAFCASDIAPKDARTTRRSTGSGWLVSHDELNIALKREQKHLLLRTTTTPPPDVATHLDQTRTIVTIAA